MKELKGFISIADFRNWDKLAKSGEPIEVFFDKESAKDAMPERTRIVECILLLKSYRKAKSWSEVTWDNTKSFPFPHCKYHPVAIYNCPDCLALQKIEIK